MGFKCKCSFPHADLSWSPLATSVSIYTRNNRKFAALANMGNQHIIVCVTVVHLYIPCGGDEKAPGCNPKALRKTSRSEELEHQEACAVPWELSSFPLCAGACGAAHCGFIPAGNEGGTVLRRQPKERSRLTSPPDSGRTRQGTH